VQTLVEKEGITVALGAQHCSDEEAGARTGEVSPRMLARLSTVYVLVGHSERRTLFGMTDELVAATAKAVVKNGMTPVICVGETEDERARSQTEARLETQVLAALEGLTPEQVGSLVLAYEPIWAIGTGRTATPEDAQEVCAAIRSVVAEVAGSAAASTVRIQYGGSVTPVNAGELLAQPDIDGALVGGASLDTDSFARIVHAARG
jgi:triosephosphate isomerase